jgi:hypothetical protein
MSIEGGIFWGKLKKKYFFLLFCMDLYYKAIVWVIFWRKLKKKFLRFCMDLYYKAIVWVIFWGNKKHFFFCISVWTYTIRLYYGSYFGEK